MQLAFDGMGDPIPATKPPRKPKKSWLPKPGVFAVVYQGDVLEQLRQMPDESVHCCVTSPPYWGGLRDYGVEGQMGQEATPSEYVEAMVGVFREVRRILRKDGTCWVNIGDSAASNWPCRRRNQIGNPSLENGKREERSPRMGDGLKDKDLALIPFRLALALQEDGWYVRQDIIWSKSNPMPESVKDRPTRAHEYLFLLTKSPKYFYDADAIAEPVTESTKVRLAQNVEAQVGSTRANGGAKTNGNMKAVVRKNNESIDRHKHGFNERYFGVGGRIAAAAAAGIADRKDKSLYQTRNKRSVWTVSTKPYKGAHFATFPPELIEPCILAGCPEGGTVIDIFGGSGTTAQVALHHGRNAVLIELNPDYIPLIEQRVGEQVRLVA